MSWIDLRRRSQDPESALLSDLINQKIQAEAQENIVDNIEDYTPILEVTSKTIRNDALFYAATKPYSSAYDVFLPREPDYNYLRLWFKNDHGGNYLTDYSKCDNIIQLHADPLAPDNPDYSSTTPKEPPIVLIGSQDYNVTPNQICNFFTSRNNHYIRVLDNPNIRITEIAATAAGFTVFTRFYITSTNNEQNTGRRSVIFSKLDSEQVDYGYEAQLADDGSLFWFVRKAGAEYSLKAATAITFTDELDYAAEDYSEVDYSADSTAPPTSPTFVDFAFNFNFSTKRMQIIKDGTIIADSNDSGYTTNCVARWGLNEGGDIDEARTVYDGANSNNGTITTAVWTTTGDHYLRFNPGDGSATDYVTVPQNSTINSYAGNITVSMWIYPIALPAGGSTHEFVTKNGTAAGSFQIVMNGTNTQLAATVKNDASATQSATVNGSFATLNTWYHVVLSWAAGSRVNIYVNNTKTQSGSTLSGTLSTGTTSLYLGSSTSGKTPNCLIDDVAIWTRTLSDAEVTSLYNQGHPLSSFPIWQEDPPEPGGAPEPITNPFVQVMNVPLPADIPNQTDFVKLHYKGLSNLVQFYDVADGQMHHGQGTYQNPTVAEYTVTGEGSGGVGATLYNLAGTNHHTDLDGDTITRVANRIDSGSNLIGKVLSRIIVQLRTGGSGPTGDITVGIRKANNQFIQFGSTLDASTMPDDSTDRPYTFDLFSNSYALAAGDWISIEGTNMGSSNQVEVRKHQDGGVANITMQDYDGNWSDESSGYQLAGTWYENTVSVAYSTIYYTSPAGHYYDSIYVNAANSPLIGKKITKATFTVNRVGAITGGNIICKIHKAAGGTVTLGTGVAASTISTSDQSISFTDRTQAYALVNGDHISLSLDAAGSDNTKYIQVKHVTVSSFTGACEQTGTTTPTWTNQANNDLVGVLESGGDTVNDPDIDPWIKLNDSVKRVNVYAATGSALLTKIFTQISARLFKVGDPQGNVTVVLRNASDAIVTSFGNIDADADLSDTVQSKNFTNTSNSTAIAAGFSISVEYAGGTDTDYVCVAVQLNIDTADQYDTNKTYIRTWNGSTYTTTIRDFSGGMYTGGGPTDPAGRTRGFEYVATDASALKAKKITKAIVNLQKVGTISSGTIYVRIRKFAGDTVAGTIGTLNAADITTSIAPYTVTNTSQQYALGTGDKVSVEFTGGDDTNYIKLITTKVDAFDGSINSFAGNFDDPTYYSAIQQDLVGELWTGGDTYTPAADEIPPPRNPYYTHDLLILAGGDDWGYDTDPRNYLASAVILPEFRFERQVWTAAMATNVKTNGCSTSAIAAGKVAKAGYFVIHADP